MVFITLKSNSLIRMLLLYLYLEILWVNSLVFPNCRALFAYILGPWSEIWHDASSLSLLTETVLWPELPFAHRAIGKYKTSPGQKNQGCLPRISAWNLPVPRRVAGGIPSVQIDNIWRLNRIMCLLPASRKEAAYQSFADRQSHVAAWGNTFT